MDAEIETKFLARLEGADFAQLKEIVRRAEGRTAGVFLGRAFQVRDVPPALLDCGYLESFPLRFDRDPSSSSFPACRIRNAGDEVAPTAHAFEAAAWATAHDWNSSARRRELVGDKFGAP